MNTVAVSNPEDRITVYPWYRFADEPVPTPEEIKEQDDVRKVRIQGGSL